MFVNKCFVWYIFDVIHLWAHLNSCNIISIYLPLTMKNEWNNQMPIHLKLKSRENTLDTYSNYWFPYGIYKNGTMYWSEYTNLQHPIKKPITFVYVFANLDHVVRLFFVLILYTRRIVLRLWQQQKLIILSVFFCYPCYWARHFIYYLSQTYLLS